MTGQGLKGMRHHGSPSTNPLRQYRRCQQTMLPYARMTSFRFKGTLSVVSPSRQDDTPSSCGVYVRHAWTDTCPCRVGVLSLATFHMA